MQRGPEKLFYNKQTDKNQNSLNKEDKNLINIEFAVILYYIAVSVKLKTFC